VTTALRRDMTKVQVQTVFNARSIVVTSSQSSLPLYHTTSKINKKNIERIKLKQKVSWKKSENQSESPWARSTEHLKH